MTHELKTWPQYFDELINDRKMFELRKDDRDFQVGDILMLREWSPPANDYTGVEVDRVITFILRGPEAEQFGLKPGYCILSLEKNP